MFCKIGYKNKISIERSAGAVVFRKIGKKIYYLLLNYSSIGNVKKKYWGFPKGHVEKGENLIETARREIQEEAGIDKLYFIKGFQTREKYFFRSKDKPILKFVTFFLAKTKESRVKISFEHTAYGWFEFKDAIRKLTFKSSKNILKKAHDFISEKGI